MSIKLYICRFFIEAFFSLIVMAFCMTMIVTDKNRTDIFLPIITGILGYWLPSPKLGASKLRALGNAINPPVVANLPVANLPVTDTDTDTEVEDNTNQA